MNDRYEHSNDRVYYENMLVACVGDGESYLRMLYRRIVKLAKRWEVKRDGHQLNHTRAFEQGT